MPLIYWSVMFGNVLMWSFEILILISALGVVAIPFGNPKFLSEAIIVELSFITLSVLVWSREMEVPRTLDDIAPISNIKRKPIAKNHRELTFNSILSFQPLILQNASQELQTKPT